MWKTTNTTETCLPFGLKSSQWVKLCSLSHSQRHTTVNTSSRSYLTESTGTLCGSSSITGTLRKNPEDLLAKYLSSLQVSVSVERRNDLLSVSVGHYLWQAHTPQHFNIRQSIETHLPEISLNLEVVKKDYCLNDGGREWLAKEWNGGGKGMKKKEESASWSFATICKYSLKQ